MTPLPTLVGECNPHSDDPRFDLYPLPEGCAGHRLRVILGLTESEYIRCFCRANLVCGRGWSLPAAREGAERLLGTPGDLVLLGRKVVRAFGLDLPPFARDGRFVVLPHPSGLCRAWNDPQAVVRARELLSEYLPGRVP